MIDVKTAVRAAIGYVNEFREYIPPRDIRLEETEYDEDRRHWVITLSFVENDITGFRSYKVFRIDANSGDVMSMKVRSVVPSR